MLYSSLAKFKSKSDKKREEDLSFLFCFPKESSYAGMIVVRPYPEPRMVLRVSTNEVEDLSIFWVFKDQG
jgi:hypothetical protein